MTQDWDALDNQLQKFSPFLRDQLNLSPEISNKLASTIAKEMKDLSDNVLNKIRSKDTVGLDDRLDELSAFQKWMDIAHNSPIHPAITRAYVITQNYICFVYLGDTCFKILQKHAEPKSAIKKCCKFLTDNPVRAFRNALAHGNWKYREDYSGLVFWSGKRRASNEPPMFEVSQNGLDFWQTLARCIAYVAFTTANDTLGGSH